MFVHHSEQRKESQRNEITLSFSFTKRWKREKILDIAQNYPLFEVERE
jgi:hypothetical protein